MSLKPIASSWHEAHRNGVNVPGLLGGGWLSQEGKTMESYLEQYEAREGGVTLHTWTDVRGAKKENFYIIGMPSTPIRS